MKLLILASIIALSIIGVLGIQDADARCFDEKYCFPNHLRITNYFGNSIDNAIAGDEYYLTSMYPITNDLLCYFGMNAPVSLCPEDEFPLVVGEKLIESAPEINYVNIIQIKDSQNYIVEIKLVNGVATDVPSDSKVLWVPEKPDTYLIENFIWSSIDNPVIMTVPSAMTVLVKSEQACSIQCLVYDPVCGEDQITYGCGIEDAACHGVKVIHDGECNDKSSELG